MANDKDILLETMQQQNEIIKSLMAENKRLKQFVARVQVDIKECFLDRQDMEYLTCNSINNSLFLLASGDDLTMNRIK